MERVFEQYKNLMIKRDNRKLKNFHLLVALTLYADFFITAWIIGNYEFLLQVEGYDEDFMDHRLKYTFIVFIQIIDIILNFFKMPLVDGKEIKDPTQVYQQYLKGPIVLDIIAAIPYNVYARKFIFLRGLKLLNFNTYQNYFDKFIEEMT